MYDCIVRHGSIFGQSLPGTQQPEARPSLTEQYELVPRERAAMFWNWEGNRAARRKVIANLQPRLYTAGLSHLRATCSLNRTSAPASLVLGGLLKITFRRFVIRGNLPLRWTFYPVALKPLRIATKAFVTFSEYMWAKKCWNKIADIFTSISNMAARKWTSITKKARKSYTNVLFGL